MKSSPLWLVLPPIVIGLLLWAAIEASLPSRSVPVLDICRGVPGPDGRTTDDQRYLSQCLQGTMPHGLPPEAEVACRGLRDTAIDGGRFNPTKLSPRDANDYYHCLVGRHGQSFQTNAQGENTRLRVPMLADISARLLGVTAWFIAILAKVALFAFCMNALRRAIARDLYRSLRILVFIVATIGTAAFYVTQFTYNEYSYLFFWQILRIIPPPGGWLQMLLDVSAYGLTFRLMFLDQVLLIWVGVAVIGACAAVTVPPRLQEIATGDAVGEGWGRQYKALTGIFLGSSIALVLGIVSTRALLQWPLALLAPEWASYKDILAISNSLLVVWGAAATIMLFAAFFPAAYVIGRRADELAYSQGRGSEEAGKWLAKHGLAIDSRAGLTRFVVALLPLLAGSYDTFFSKSLG